MSKKSKGLPSIGIELGRIRNLRWTHNAVRKFEDAALRYLGIPLAGTVRADALLQQAITNPTIQTYALFFALEKDAEDNNEKDFTTSTVDDLLTEYKERGGSMDDLIAPLQRSFLIANDPSRLASFEESLKVLRTIAAAQKTLNEKQAKKTAIENQKNLKNLETQIAELDIGTELSDSVKSNSD